MTVDFALEKVPEMHVIAHSWAGAWSEVRIRTEFEKLDAWARARRLRTGRWIFMEPGHRRWTVAIEVRGSTRGDRAVRRRTLAATRVAAVTFDPERVAARVIYHGLNDWVKWRRRAREIRAVGPSRELYPGNPWKDPKAWARTQVQFVVR